MLCPQTAGHHRGGRADVSPGRGAHGSGPAPRCRGMPIAADAPPDFATDTHVPPRTWCMLPCLPAFCKGAVHGEGVRRHRPAWPRGATRPWVTPHTSLDVPQGGAWLHGRCSWTRGGPPGLPHVPYSEGCRSWPRRRRPPCAGTGSYLTRGKSNRIVQEDVLEVWWCGRGTRGGAARDGLEHLCHGEP